MAQIIEIPKAERPLPVGSSIVTIERPVNLANVRCAGTINVGAYSYGNADTLIYEADIGRFCSLAHRVLVGPFEHPTDWLSSSGFAWGDNIFAAYGQYEAMVSDERLERNSLRTVIGNDVWVGANVVIRRGVSIGNGAIIGAGSIVTKDVPPYAIMGGVPAKILRFRFDESTVLRLQNLRWWDYVLDRKTLQNPRYSDVSASLDAIEDAIQSGKLKRLTPATVTITTNASGQVTRLTP